MRWFQGILLLSSGWAAVSSANGREWTDNTGQHRLEAELVMSMGERVCLRTPDNKFKSCPFKRLSAVDQQYVEEHERDTTDISVPDRAEASRAAERSAGGSAGHRSAGAPLVAEAQLGEGTLDSDVAKGARAFNVSMQTAQQQDWLERYVYSGCRGTFHIFASPPDYLRKELANAQQSAARLPDLSRVRGTAHYWLWGHHYLSLLTQTDGPNLSYFFYYKPYGGDAFITQWAFSRYPDSCDCYSVWCLTRKGWSLYASLYREKLNW